MASSTPPHCSLTTTKPTHQNHLFHLQNHHHHHHHPPWSTPKYTPLGSSLTTTIPNPTQQLDHDFRGQRSTRFVSKMHFNRPQHASTRHGVAAVEALHKVLEYETNYINSVLEGFGVKLSGSNDYGFLLRELGNRGECEKAVKCFSFAVKKERNRNEQGKLATSIISILGRLHRVELAKNVFDTANNEGYGNNVYIYSALISAYGRAGCVEEALRVFESMKRNGVRANLVTYNAVIDACGKGGVEFGKAKSVFDEMVKSGVVPDKITYNSMISVCGRCGWWETARGVLNEMIFRGIEPDMFTYNTLLDGICKAGQMDLAFDIMAEMPGKGVWPNVITYSTMVDGCAKAGRLNDALNLVNEMKLAGIGLDRVSFNTLLSTYAKLGRFAEALEVCKDMANLGIERDAVTYNALLCGYGKQGDYEEMKKLFKEMKMERISPNLLTYSTLIDVYSKGGLYKEAMEVYKEFRNAGLKTDVVMYSALIDALCKNGLVESAVALLDEMTKEGIQPNVITYNSIIDAFGRPTMVEFQEGAESKVSSDNKNNNKVMKCFEQLVCEKARPSREDTKRKSKEISCILGVFHRMHELKIKPNVVTFSAILNACSRCNSFEDASMLLEELRLFDNQVYGVAHGLLTGSKGNAWTRAQSLFNEVQRMDTSTASAFYNALTDMLWHFGQRRGAQLVVLEGKGRHVWENAWSSSCLDLHLMSIGAAQAMVHAWLLNIHSIVVDGHELPKLISILTGWGKHSKVVGDGCLRRTVDALLAGIGAPFYVAKSNIGRFISPGSDVAAWLREKGTLKILILRDNIYPEPNVQSNQELVPLL